MNDVNSLSIEKSTCQEKRLQRNGFYQSVAACRPALFKYCRRLTGSPWDAEDLVQETLMVAYGRLADKHAGIANLQSYLFRVATNQWISWCRRSKFMDSNSVVPESTYETDFFVVNDSLAFLANRLAPRERVAFVLSEVFEYKNEEIAEILGNTEGAVKAALVRAREKVRDLNSSEGLQTRKPSAPLDNSLVQRAVDAFNRRDLESFASLFAVTAVANGPGCFLETGIDEIKKGSLFFTINTFDGKPQESNMRAEAIQAGGETLFALFNNDRLDDIWRFTIEDGNILRFDCYYCCPDVLEEIASALHKPANNHGYWFEQKRGNS